MYTSYKLICFLFVCLDGKGDVNVFTFYSLFLLCLVSAFVVHLRVCKLIEGVGVNSTGLDMLKVRKRRHIRFRWRFVKDLK